MTASKYAQTVISELVIFMECCKLQKPRTGAMVLEIDICFLDYLIVDRCENNLVKNVGMSIEVKTECIFYNLYERGNSFLIRLYNV